MYPPMFFLMNSGGGGGPLVQQVEAKIGPCAGSGVKTGVLASHSAGADQPSGECCIGRNQYDDKLKGVRYMWRTRKAGRNARADFLACACRRTWRRGARHDGRRRGRDGAPFGVCSAHTDNARAAVGCAAFAVHEGRMQQLLARTRRFRRMRRGHTAQIGARSRTRTAPRCSPRTRATVLAACERGACVRAASGVLIARVRTQLLPTPLGFTLRPQAIAEHAARCLRKARAPRVGRDSGGYDKRRSIVAGGVRLEAVFPRRSGLKMSGVGG
ncbi:hypothetical protein B0H10DRAFT_1958467 [Mycena sp. CBHHK59/15]|nr:hypothetical protein B0H10DRAFT_1958467 [Mycena sp. CBHHK59/15]